MRLGAVYIHCNRRLLMTVCVCLLSVYVMPFLHRNGFHVLTQVTALCSKICHRKDKEVT
jgi:hypothetical protein